LVGALCVPVSRISGNLFALIRKNRSPLSPLRKTIAMLSLLNSQSYPVLCPPSCLHYDYPSLVEMETHDASSNHCHSWLDDPFTLQELEFAISSSKRGSAPGLDQIDYIIIREIPNDLRLLLLDIYNDLFSQGLFPFFWSTSLIVFIPKLGGKGLRPIALTSCLLKIFEKMVYRRLQWLTESYFIIPEFQAGFRNSRSCMDNLVILTNRIQSTFLRGDSVIATNILFQDLRNLGFPARTCKFIENLLAERSLIVSLNGELQGPYLSRKGLHKGRYSGLCFLTSI